MRHPLRRRTPALLVTVLAASALGGLLIAPGPAVPPSPSLADAPVSPGSPAAGTSVEGADAVEGSASRPAGSTSSTTPVPARASERPSTTSSPRRPAASAGDTPTRAAAGRAGVAQASSAPSSGRVAGPQDPPAVTHEHDEHDEGDVEAAFTGRVVEAPTEVAAVLAALEAAGGAQAVPPGPDDVQALVATAAGGVATIGPSPARPNAAQSTPPRAPTPAPNPTPTLRPGTHPSAPTFPAWIEPLSSYEAEDTCDPVAKPGARDLVSLLEATYGSSIANNIVRACSSKKTGHKAGRAVDWMVNSRNSAQGALGDAFVAWLLATDGNGNRYAMARRLGVMYVIWRGRMFGTYNQQWREYSSCLTTMTSKAEDNTCHRNHVHVSLTWAGARRETTWWTLAHGLPRCEATSPVAWTPLRAGVGRRLGGARLLDTAAGLGTPQAPLPCAVPAGASVGVPVLGRGGVPTTGVAAVQVKVEARGPKAGTSLARLGPPLSPPGAGAGASGLAVPAGRSVAGTMWLQVHADGNVYLRAGVSAVDLKLDVLGWAAATPPVSPDTAVKKVTGRRTPSR